MEFILPIVGVLLKGSNYFRNKLATVVTKPMPKCDEKESARSDKNVEEFAKNNDVFEIDFNQIGDVSELERFKTLTLNHAKRGCPNIKIWHSEVIKNLYSSGFGRADSLGDTADLSQQGGGQEASDQEHLGGRSDCGCSSTCEFGC